MQQTPKDESFKKVENELEYEVQPEFAGFVEKLFHKKVGQLYWNDYVRSAFSKCDWRPQWTKIQDLDITALCRVVLNKNGAKDLLFDTRKDDEFGDLLEIRDYIFKLRTLRNRCGHNTLENINEVKDDDCYFLVDFLIKIKANEETKDHVKQCIDDLRGKKNANNPSEIFQELKDFKKEVQKFQALVAHTSKISRRNTSSWTIYNNELDQDLYLQAGKEENQDEKVYIFKIKGKTYIKDNFEPNNQWEHFHNKNKSGIDYSQRDISISWETFKEIFKKENPVDFKKHLWKIIDYKNRCIIDNPNYQEES